MNDRLNRTLLLVCAVLLCTVVHGQPYRDLMRRSDANFYDIQAAANAYFEIHGKAGGAYKRYKRWEYMMEPRVYPDGYLPEGAFGQAMAAMGKLQGSEPDFKTDWANLGPFGTGSTRAAWRFTEPSMGTGRLNVVRRHGNLVYVGSPAGGLWTYDLGGGTGWVNATDNMVIGGIAVPIGVSGIAFTSTGVYIATGDGPGRDLYGVSGNLTHGVGNGGLLGQGVWYKPFTGGNGWVLKNQGLAQGAYAYAILAHPTDAKVLWLADTKGLWKTENSGTSWTQIENGQFYDLELKPGDPMTVYAVGTDEATGMTHFYRSTDAGDSFQKISGGALPDPAGTSYGEIAVSAQDPMRVYYATASTTNGHYLSGVFASTDAGLTFTDPGGDGINFLSENASDYHMAIAANPANANELWVGSRALYHSTDAGVNFAQIGDPGLEPGDPNFIHADMHDLYYDGLDLYMAHDGGLYVNSGATPETFVGTDGQAIAQIYDVAAWRGQPFGNGLFAGTQDNGPIINTGGWQHPGGVSVNRDVTSVIVHPANEQVIYFADNFKKVHQSIDGGSSWIIMDETDEDQTQWLEENTAWVLPIDYELAQTDHVYVGQQNVWEVKPNGPGISWVKLSDFGDQGNDRIWSLDVHATDANYIVAATLNKIYRTTNKGTTAWSNITYNLPVNSACISDVLIHPQDPQRIFVTMSGYSIGDKVFEIDLSVPSQTSWKNISGGLFPDPVNCIAFMPSFQCVPDHLVIGTDEAIFAYDLTSTGNSNWKRIPNSKGLPATIYTDIELTRENNDVWMIAATFGRGIYETEVKDPKDVSIPNPVFQRQLAVANGSQGFTGPTDNDSKFGRALEVMVPPDANGNYWLLAGEPHANMHVPRQPGDGRGELWMLKMDATHTVVKEIRITDTWSYTLQDTGFFGHSIATLDYNAEDARARIAVGAPGDRDHSACPGVLAPWSSFVGSVYILDVDTNGIVHNTVHIDTLPDNCNRTTYYGGSAIWSMGWDIAAVDLNGDAYKDIVVLAPLSQLVSTRHEPGAIILMTLDAQGNLIEAKNMLHYDLNPMAALPPPGRDFQSWSIDVADMDGDGIDDFVVGSPDYINPVIGPVDDPEGVYIFYMTNLENGKIKNWAYINDAEVCDFNLEADDRFGTAVEVLGDLDGDEIPEIAVGAPHDSEFGFADGSFYILYPNIDGTVKETRKFSSKEEGDFATAPYFQRQLGSGLVSEDLNGDGLPELIVGAEGYWAPNHLDGGFYIVEFSQTVSPKTAESAPKQNPFRIYPNPNTGSFSIRHLGGAAEGDFALQLYDLKGQKVHTAALGAFTQSATRHIEVPQLPNGLYLVVLQGKNARYQQKLIIQR